MGLWIVGLEFEGNVGFRVWGLEFKGQCRGLICCRMPLCGVYSACIDTLGLGLRV